MLYKLCAALTRHRFRRPVRVDVHFDDHGHGLGCTRWYICRVCGQVVREE